MTGARTPIAGSASDYTGPFEKFSKEIEEGYQKALDKFDEIVDKLNSWGTRMKLAALGPGIVWMIKSGLDKLSDGLKRVKEFVQSLLEHHTPIISLMRQSFAWTEKVKGPVSNLSFETTSPASENLYHWTGPAKLAYNDKAKAMQAAVNECSSRAEFISEWLFTITKTNVEYVKKLAEIITFLIGKIVDACVEAGSIIGLPHLGATLGEAAGTVAEKELNILLQMGENLISAMGNVRQVRGTLNSNEALPKGAWPQVVRG